MILTRIFLTLILLFQLSTGFSSVMPVVKEPKGENPKSLLMIGNSFMYYNNGVHNPLVRLIRASNELGKGHKIRSITINGSSLSWHDVNSYINNYPNAKIYAAPGLKKKRKDIQFNGTLLDEPNEEWQEEIDQMVFRGCFFMKEVFFFHKETKTLIITDFIQSIHPYHNLFERMMGRIGGIYNNPSPPRDLRLMMRLDRQTTKQSVERVKQWHFDKIIIAHGQLITRDARIVFNKAFDWI